MVHLSFQNGLRVGEKNTTIHVDAHKAIEGSLCLTHAHSDHVKGLSKKANVFSTQATKDLAQVTNKAPHESWTCLEFNRSYSFDHDLTMSFHASGHILGSSQALFSKDQTVLVSSDLLLQDHPFWSSPQMPTCDTLLIESTFGLPQFSFPTREDVFNRMKNWAQKSLNEKKLIILGGYALGKSQELVWFSNEYLGITPHVAEPIVPFNDVYQKHGIKLGEYETLNGNAHDAQVIILPPSWAKADILHALSFSSKKKIASALCTGWNRRANVFDELFPLSDHADFDSLLQAVEESGAKNVYTMHGFEAELAKSIRQKLKIRAQPLSTLHPHSLASFFS